MTDDHTPRLARQLLILALLFLAAGVGDGHDAHTFASYADEDLSANNTVHGGTLDLNLAELGPANVESTVDEAGSDQLAGTWADPAHSDNDTVYNTIELNSTQSTLSADRIALSVSYTENDTAGGTDGNVDATARTFEVRSFEYGGRELVGTTVTDENGNGIVDIEDLTHGDSATNLTSLSGLSAGETITLTLELGGDSTRSGGIGSGDGLDLALEIGAHASTFTETDRTAENTITYG